VWNLYGPTETTIWSTVDRVTPGVLPIMVGSPIANTQVHVVDAAGALAPIGILGELCIGGDGVALGYRGRPELTAERFVSDRFSARPGARMYRTGDLARWHPDGRLECLGRLDHQVKVRGFRIELGEVEAALVRHPAIRQAVATVFGDAADVRLAAHVVLEDAASFDDQDLRGFLRHSLPEYMVPAVFVPMAALPLTANGKIDRKALLVPASAPAAQDSRARPTTDFERRVAAIWTEVLGPIDIPVDATFFDLGGHSLLIARVRGRLEQQLGRSISMADLFEYQTVRSLAAHLERQGGEAAGETPGVVRRVERRRVRSAG
jgi:acyl carrier protein